MYSFYFCESLRDTVKTSVIIADCVVELIGSILYLRVRGKRQVKTRHSLLGNYMLRLEIV